MEYQRLKEKLETILSSPELPFEEDLTAVDCKQMYDILCKIEQGTLIELPILDKEILEDYAHRMFDSWNDITGAIHNGCSWYSEVLSVIDDIVGMVYGITKRQAKKRLLELQSGTKL